MLESAAARCPSDLRSVCDSQAIAGYCGTLAAYLQDACGAHEGSSLTRTVLFGLQRPPLDGGASVVRLEEDSTVDDVAPYLVPFLITNARETLQISAPVAAVRSCTVSDAHMASVCDVNGSILVSARLKYFTHSSHVLRHADACEPCMSLILVLRTVVVLPST